MHPESYPVVDKIIDVTKKPLNELMGNQSVLNSLEPLQLTDDKFGLPTIKDILAELNKPGRDPRPEFKMATFKEGIDAITDLKPGMRLEGVITNVANFGAFVDIGVHQDGLVHISACSDSYVTDIHKILNVGQIVKVTVVDVDVARKRIALTMKSDKPSRVKKPHVERAGKAKTAKPLSAFASKLQKAFK